MKQKICSSRAVSALTILMRHGQASYTKAEDEGGDTVEGTLTQEGVKTISDSAEGVALQIQKLREKNLLMLTSPKRRCKESADIVKKYVSDHQIVCSLEVSDSIRDVRVIGRLGNIPNSYTRWEMHAKQGENWFASWIRLAGEGGEFYPGEERPEDIVKRVKKITYPSGPSLFICHEEVLYAFSQIFDIAWSPPDYGEVWYVFPR